MEILFKLGSPNVKLALIPIIQLLPNLRDVFGINILEGTTWKLPLKRNYFTQVQSMSEITEETIENLPELFLSILFKKLDSNALPYLIRYNHIELFKQRYNPSLMSDDNIIGYGYIVKEIVKKDNLDLLEWVNQKTKLISEMCKNQIYYYGSLKFLKWYDRIFGIPMNDFASPTKDFFCYAHYENHELIPKTPLLTSNVHRKYTYNNKMERRSIFERGGIDIQKWIHEKNFQPTKDDIKDLCVYASKKGDIETLNWVNEIYPNSNEEIQKNNLFLWAVDNGNIKLLNSLYNNYKFDFEKLITINHYYAISSPSINGHLKTLIWLINKFSGYFSGEKLLYRMYDIFFMAAVNDHLNILKWIQKNYHFTDEEIKNMYHTMNFNEYSSIEIVRWMYETFHFNMREDKSAISNDLKNFASNGNLLIFQWICKKFSLTIDDITDNDNEIFRWAVKYENTKIVKWLLDTYDLSKIKDKSYYNSNFYSGASKGNFDVSLWVDEIFHVKLPSPMNWKQCFYWAVERRDFTLLKWIKKIFIVFRNDFTTDDMDMIIGNSSGVDDFMADLE